MELILIDMNEAAPFVSLGKHLKYVRENSKQSLAEVSGAVEIDENTLTKIEAGVERPSEDILLLLISHFEVKDQEALNLWQLADYDSDLPDQMRPEVDIIPGGARVVMLMAVDMRTMYSDGLEVSLSDAGLTLQFTQSSGKKQPNPVSRIGMSYDQAEKVLKQLEQALLCHKYSGGKSLPSGEN